jgi:hypothetical protein
MMEPPVEIFRDRAKPCHPNGTFAPEFDRRMASAVPHRFQTLPMSGGGFNL